MPASPQSFTWIEIWARIYFRPTEKNFREILADPKFHIARAFLWTILNGAFAAFFESLASRAQGSLFNDYLCMNLIGVPFIATLALLMVSLLPIYASGQFSKVEDKNKFMYCVAAAFAPTLLGYSLLHLIGSLLANLSPLLDLFLKLLALFLTIYFLWLVKKCFYATRIKRLGMPRSVDAIHKSLELKGGLLILAITAFFKSIAVRSPMISFATLGLLIYLGVRVLSDLTERRRAKQLSDQGQHTFGMVIKKWPVDKYLSISSVVALKIKLQSAYYITFEYTIAGHKYVITRKIPKKDYVLLNDGCPVRIRYLLDEPETVQLMPEGNFN